MKSKKLLVFSLALLAVFAVSAVVGAEETIKVGALFGLTGEMAAIANPAAQGAELAAEQINAQGGCWARKSSSSSTTPRATPK